MSKQQDPFIVKVGIGLKSSILLLALVMSTNVTLQPAFRMVVPDAPEAYRMIVPDAPDVVPDSPEAFRMVVPDGPE